MKKALSILLAVVCIASSGIQLAVAQPAATPATEPGCGELTYYEQDGVVIVQEGVQLSRAAQPRFLHINTITARMVEDGGLATCTSTTMVDRDYKYKMVSAVRRSKDGKTWSTVKSWTTTKSGVISIDMEHEYYLTAGYQYRLDTTVSTYSGTTLLESATCSSSVVYY